MRTNKISIVIVDDHPMVRAGLRSLLAVDDIKVIGEANSGKEGVALIKELLPDVALMDIRMKDMDGIEALKSIKEAKLSTRVIMVTTYRNTTYLLQALAMGAAGFVLKNIAPEDLRTNVRAVAAGESGIDQLFLQRVLRELHEAEEAQADAQSSSSEPLTPRELDVLQLIVEGLTNQAIAHILGITAGTAKTYVQTILRKLNVSDRTQAAVKAIRTGLTK